MPNLGIKLEELKELLSIGHEAVFVLNGKEYIIQPECAKESKELVMYQSEPEVVYLCRVPIPKNACTTVSDRIRCAVGKETVEQMLSRKCIDGKSFLDLIKQIHVEEIF